MDNAGQAVPFCRNDWGQDIVYLFFRKQNYAKLGIRFSPVGTTYGILGLGNNIVPKSRLS